LCVVAVIVYARRDFTARDRVIAELARTNAELKQRLAERTIERDDVARRNAPLRDRKRGRLSEKSIHDHLAPLKQILNGAVHERRVPDNPLPPSALPVRAGRTDAPIRWRNGRAG
jgi:hypothetical protein